MAAMTPMKAFRIKGDEIYTEDYSGQRELVAKCPIDKLDWVVNSMAGYHKTIPILDWDEPWIAE